TTNVKWIGARTFHFTQMSTSGFLSHNRQGGWNKGKFVQTDVPFTLEHDRDIEFLVDTEIVDETNSTASMQNIARTFELTQATPESNALFFSRCAAKAESITGLNSETALASYTKANVLSKLKAMISKCKRYKAMGALIVYVRTEIMDLLELCEEIHRHIEVTQIAEGGAGIETRIAKIDGVPIMEVIDDDVFYDKFKYDPVDNADDFEGGFEPASDAKKINVLVVSPLTTKFVPKTSHIYTFAPGTHTEGDGYLYQHRRLSDTFVFPNGKTNTIDSLFVDVQPVAVDENDDSGDDDSGNTGD
ncbi:MAG: phage capsid protein, partial [Clostridia bacterium]|nr:phage capsid protein [Clostridia bacterium]